MLCHLAEDGRTFFFKGPRIVFSSPFLAGINSFMEEEPSRSQHFPSGFSSEALWAQAFQENVFKISYPGDSSASFTLSTISSRGQKCAEREVAQDGSQPLKANCPPVRLCWLATKLQESTYLYLPSAGIQACSTMPGFSLLGDGTRLRLVHTELSPVRRDCH